MRETDQQIALCEWAGWKQFYGSWVDSKGDFVYLTDTNSLDVLHEMEKRLTWPQRTLYAHILTRILLLENRIEYPQDEPTDLVEEFTVLNATAPQRREALLRTLNLWREDSNEEGK